MQGKVNSLVWGIVFAGIIIFLIGCYYAVIEAGIPYQDPTLELQIEYAINIGIGKVLTKCGGLTFIVGLLFRIILGITWKQTKHEESEELSDNMGETVTKKDGDERTNGAGKS